MILKITQVDMNGYTGRELHPAKSDEGLLVVPLRMAAFLVDETLAIDPAIIDTDQGEYAEPGT